MGYSRVEFRGWWAGGLSLIWLGCIGHPHLTGTGEICQRLINRNQLVMILFLYVILNLKSGTKERKRISNLGIVWVYSENRESEQQLNDG